MAIDDQLQLLGPLRSEVGGDLELIIDGNLLRQFLVVIDFPRRKLLLHADPRSSALPADTVTGLGL